MVTTHVALIRGINVGGRNKVPMADLRALFESLGHSDVRTHIQSGNVIFRSDSDVAATDLEQAIGEGLGVHPVVVLRTPADLRAVMDADPFPDADRSKRHVGFMARAGSDEKLDGLDLDQFRPEEVVIDGRHQHLHLPDGMGRAKLPAYLDRHLGIPTTIRGWKTVRKILELATD